MKKVLVTGGCGFIGSNLVPKLLSMGCEVRVLDNLSRGSVSYLNGADVELVKGDIRDQVATSRALKNVDTVFHLAAFGSVLESITDPKTNFEINVGGTLNLLGCAVKARVEQFLFSSTGGALIGNAKPPVNEQSIPKPISPYGAGKLACEGYLNAFAGSYGLRTKILRFANVYGPISEHKLGAVTMFIKGVMAGKPIHIHGDGSASRDFLHVDDLCCGIVAMAEAELAPATVLHLASGQETTILELAKLIAKVGGRPEHEIILGKSRQGEVTRNFALFDQAKKVLGFEPSIDLETGMRRTWDWFQEYLQGKK